MSEVAYTYRNYAIASYLVHGHTPWGIRLWGEEPCLRYCGDDGWIMCCNHVLTDSEVADWTAAGVAKISDVPSARDGARLVHNGDRTLKWLSECWDSLSDGYEFDHAA